ncbi:T9SS type A sorting domain-containing protein [Polaribacter sp.]|uniref:T9SS type A sorting domain-containing protein n=1 Tax=Polaribacter sp. TaxID=1920175 RepID=UPI003F6B5B72
MKKTILIYTLLCSVTFFAQNWGEQILNQPNTGTNYSFGYSVDIDGNYAVIGAPGENERTGSAHIYKKDVNGVWNYHQKIEAFVGQHDDEYFGYIVAIQGDYIFVSAPTDRLNEELFQSPAGSVMIYKKDVNDVWSGVQRLRSSDIRYGDYFGSDIDVDGDFLVVGAYQQDYDADNLNQETSAGAAYVFQKNINDVWVEVQKLTPSHRDYSDNVGSSVSISGDYIVLASESDTDAANVNRIAGNGSVFVFKKNLAGVWSEVQKLKPTNGISYSEFGFGDVSISGDYIAVGAKNLDQFNNNEWYYGHVYIFKKDGDDIWNESQIVKVPYPASNFGTAVSLDQNLLLVSAPESRVQENGSNVSGVGISYLFQKDDNDNYILVESIQASQAVANSNIGSGQYNSDISKNAIALDNNQFILGSQRTPRTIGANTYFLAGTAYISGDISNVLAEDISWTGNTDSNWNDPLNWSPNIVPTETNDVILNNVANAPNIANGQNHTINNLTTFENLNIETNASLTIQGNIDQRAQITVNSAVDSNGSLIVNGNQTNPNPSNTTYNRYVSGNSNHWHLISSPISEVDIDDFASNEPLTNGQGNNRGLSWYNNVNETWEYYQAGAVGSGDFPNGKGYAINTSENTTLEFTGLLNASILENYPITVNGNGWNLVGNPYASFLHANANANATNFLTTNVNQLDPIAANLYVWNPTLSSYETIGNGDEAKYIAPGQAFFIKSKAGGGNINVTKNMQTHRSENLFFKSNPTQKIVLEINDDEKISRSTIAFKEGMTNDLDVSYDAAVFSGVATNFSIYTQLLENYENTKFAVQYLPKLNDETVVIPVGILLNEEKKVNLKLKESNLESGYTIYLEDRLLDDFTELTLQKPYAFNHSLQSNGLGRFYIHIQKSTLSTETIANNTIKAYKVDASTLRVNGVKNGILNLYDITGKKIIKNLTINQTNQTFSFPNLNSGVYILNITENNGGKLTQKIIF